MRRTTTLFALLLMATLVFAEPGGDVGDVFELNGENANPPPPGTIGMDVNPDSWGITPAPEYHHERIHNEDGSMLPDPDVDLEDWQGPLAPASYSVFFWAGDPDYGEEEGLFMMFGGQVWKFDHAQGGYVCPCGSHLIIFHGYDDDGVGHWSAYEKTRRSGDGSYYYTKTQEGTYTNP